MDDVNEHYQALRVTPYPNTETNLDIVIQSLHLILGEMFVISKEFSKKQKWHLHAVFYDIDFNKDNFRDKLYELLTQKIDDWDITKKGNTVFTCLPVESLERAVMYCCKDKDILFQGNDVWKEYVEECKKKSFSKPTSIKELMGDLFLRFENDELNERSLWIEMVTERAQFSDQKTRYADIDAFVETFKIKKYGKEYVQAVWEQRNLST